MTGNAKKRYEPVSSKVDFPQLETSVLEAWREADLTHRVDRERADAPLFVFYEGPPTANGSPGIHHVLSRSFKDVILRYKTMRGFRPLRRGGWDTHGLPVELEIEKELGISSKQEIEELGIEEFNRRCRESVFRYVGEWEAMTDRAGVWLDMDNAYVTYHNSYIESAWWVFKRLWDKGLVYEGYKVTPHCPRCVTSLSSHEVALGYQEDTPDPSIYIRFPAKEAQSMSYGASSSALAALGYDNGRWTAPRPAFIAWTTTPWTLTANCALAVGPDVTYVLSENDGGERAIVAEALAASVLGDGWHEVARCTGADLVGIEYDAPYGAFLSQRGHSHRVLPADYVSTADGTGIVHSAVAYGAEDAELGRAHGIETVHTVDVHGVLADDFPGGGTFVKDADKQLIRDLDERGLLFHDASPYKHTYPFCWRCGTPLLYYAKTSWYIRTTAMKDEMLAGNRGIEWVPEHIKEGRFGEWLRNNVDWSVSRERYWGTPIPIWRCAEDPRHIAVAGSTADLAERVTDETRGLLDGLDLHRPYVDRVELRCGEPGCGGTMQRVTEVADAWYDSGAMPFAQWEYPVTVPGPHGEEVTLNSVDDLIASPLFPANYITEAVDQTRGWFYSLLALSTLITGKPSYESCLVLGLILDGKGEKMSKSKGNVVDPWTVMNEHGADALRWYLFTAAPAGDARRFSPDLVKETLRQFLLTLWNTYSFYVTYANIDGFDPDAHAEYWKDGRVGEPTLAAPPPNELDRWIVSELNGLVAQVADDLDSLNPTGAGRRIQEFVNLLSNWYVRRSRRRFWKAENDDDKTWAYVTLYSCLLTLDKLIAPMTPFVADAIFRNLAPRTGDADETKHVVPAEAGTSPGPLSPRERAGVRVPGGAVDGGSASGGTAPVVPAEAGTSPGSLSPRDRAGVRVPGGAVDGGRASGGTAPVVPAEAGTSPDSLSPRDRAGVRGADEPRSVHLEMYPDTDPALTDETLDRAVRLAMRIASLGRNARSRSGVKVRQPLARVLVSPRAGDEELLPLIESQVLDELNVKAMEVAEAESFATFSLKPNLPVLGPKLGASMGAARQAIAGADAAAVAAAIRSGGYGSIEIGGFTFDPGDFLVEVEDKPGVTAASEGPLLVGIDTTLTPELEAEGTSREFVHRVQNMRKSAGFAIEDRIVTYVVPAPPSVVPAPPSVVPAPPSVVPAKAGTSPPSLPASLAAQEAYIRQETLSDALHASTPPSGAYTEEHEIDGATLTVGVARVVRS